jgi:uncharacterized membrane protein YhaH (DUF805 family)
MSLRSRLARKPYWIGMGFLMGLQALAAAVALEGAGWAVLLGLDDILIAALISRRMRDFGRSPFWGWLGMVVASFAAPVAAALASPRPSGALASLLAPPPASGTVTLILVGVLIGAVGLVRGDPGANRYGPATVSAPPPDRPAQDGGDESATAADAIIARSLAALKTDAKPGVAASPRQASKAVAPVFGKRR